MPVYYAQVQPHGPVRIGFTERLGERLQNIGAWCPYPVELLVQIPNGGPIAEAWLHRRYRELKLKDSWFGPGLLLLQDAEALTSGRLPEGMPAELTHHWASRDVRQVGRLREIRESIFGLSMRDFAALAGVSTATMSTWELTGSISPRGMVLVMELAAEQGHELAADDFYHISPRHTGAA